VNEASDDARRQGEAQDVKGQLARDREYLKPLVTYSAKNVNRRQGLTGQQESLGRGIRASGLSGA
jgi:hypothetical protein